MRIGDLETLTTFHDKLNPDLWENNRLKPQVRLALFKIAKAFVEFINVDDLELTDITISGSNASFNYNNKSDIDLHLIANSNGPCKVNLKDLFQAKKVIFNDQHDITILGHAVEVYVQGSEDAHISNGVYSIYNDNWVAFPKKITAKPDITNIEHKFEHLEEEIKQALESGDPQTIARLKKRIKDMRQSGLEKNGEFGAENLAFKLLRNTGLIQKLYDAETIETDKELSLGQQGVAEGLGQDYLSQIPNLSWKPVSRNVWNIIQDEGLDEEQDTPSHRDWVMASLSIDTKDAQALMAFENDAIEDFNRFDIHLKSRYPGLTDLIDYDRGTVTIVKPINKQGVAEGNAFLGALNTARKNNLEYFIVDGKKYKVKKNKKIVKEEELTEKWSKKYKRSIDCSHPKGFSQKAHCAGRKKK